MDEITNHGERAIARLMRQYRGGENWQRLVRALLGEAQRIEAAITKLRTLRWLDTAEGAQLDGLGRILGKARDGRTDADYRVQLRGAILANSSSGTADQILTYFRAAVPGLAAYRLSEFYPMSLLVELQGELTEDPASVLARLREVKMGGVAAMLQYELSPDAEVMRLRGPDMGSQPGTSATQNLAATGTSLFVGDLTVFPASGFVVLDFGQDNEETRPFTKGADRLTLGTAAAFTHTAPFSVFLAENCGLGDANDETIGGKLAGIVR